MLSVSEVAKRLRCHRQTVLRLVWSHRLPAVRLGRALRIPADSLARLGVEAEKDQEVNRGAA